MAAGQAKSDADDVARFFHGNAGLSRSSTLVPFRCGIPQRVWVVVSIM